MEKYSSEIKKIDSYKIDQEIVQYYVRQYNQKMRKKQTSYVPCPETISLILMNTSTTNNKFLLYTRGIEFRVQGIRMRRCGGIVD